MSILSGLFLSKLSFLADLTAAQNCKISDFLGLEPWYRYLPKNDFDGCTIKHFQFFPNAAGQADLPLVLLAVVDDMLRIAGIVAVSFVIVGAFRYVASQGNPEETGRAQSTIINALIGTAVAITATVFVNFLGQSLGQ